jgi:hypothetical protein
MAEKLVTPSAPNWLDLAFQKAVSFMPSQTGLFSSAPRPTNERLFIETVGKGRTAPITEADFTADELKQLQQLVLEDYQKQITSLQNTIDYNLEFSKRTQSAENRALAKQRIQDAQLKLKQFQLNPQGSVGYAAYKDAPMSPDLEAGKTAGGSLATTLGRFGYTLDPKTKMISINDKYKFNTYETPPNMGEYKVNSMIESAGTGNVYPAIRDMAGRLLPPSKGVPIYINLDYNDPFGDTTK